MGLFDFAKYNKMESALLSEYTDAFTRMGMSERDAKRNAEDMLNKAIKESKKDGMYYLQENMGDIVFGGMEAKDNLSRKLADIIRKNTAKNREEGVTDEDTKIWWNLGEVGRRMMIDDDNNARMAAFISELEKSQETSKEKAAEKAAQRVRQYHPMYGNPADTELLKGDDRHLPYELKIRVNAYIAKMSKDDPEEFRKNIENSTSYNALIRREIRAGNL